MSGFLINRRNLEIDAYTGRRLCEKALKGDSYLQAKVRDLE